MELSSPATLSLSLFFFFFFYVYLLRLSHAQQSYVNNKQLACYNNLSITNGYLCDGLERSCASYLTFRSIPPYDSASTIGYLLNSEPSMIAQINNITDVDLIPLNTDIIIPVNCSCSGSLYQYNASYNLKYDTETYFSVANDTYQGLTTCQALINQNPYDSRNLSVGLKLLVPLRCACPSRNQTASGVKFLLSYLVTWKDSISSIGDTFGVDEQSINDANELSSDSTIFPFTPILVPLKTEPSKIPNPTPPPPSQGLSEPPTVSVEKGKSSKKWVFVGIGIGVGSIILALFGFLVWFKRCRRPRSQQSKPAPEAQKLGDSAEYTAIPENKSGYVSSEGVRYFVDSLNVYKFEELQRVTGYFNEDNRIKGSVYHGVINGDNAAIKRMKGDVTNEINILKQINHSSVIRLSGFCVHEGNTYLVHEFAENGSLSDWLHEKKYQTRCLGWKQRVQIAYDVADGLNYLHNYTNPPYIHKDLKSSNILLNGNFRAKIANFGLARKVDDQEDGGLQLTRHVVGTQGYMAPEYLENGVVTPKLDVFAFGVVMLELLSGREAASDSDDGKTGEFLLFASIKQVLEGENVREKLRGFIDPSLKLEYPLDLAFSMAQLAMNCVDHDLNARPTMTDVFMSLSKSLSSALDWDPSDELEHSRSLSRGSS